MRQGHPAWMVGSGLLGLFACSSAPPSSPAASVEAPISIDLGEPTNDDTARIQAILDHGNTVTLRPERTYLIRHKLWLRSGSGIVTPAGQPRARLLMTRDFNNVSTVWWEGARQDSVGMVAARGVRNVTLTNFALQREFLDGTHVLGIWLQGASDVLISGLDVSQFSIGQMIEVESSNNVTIRNSYFHDSWFSQCHVPEGATECRGQLTAIEIDNNKLTDSSGASYGSKNVVIANNRIRNLRVRAPYPDYETDGITVLHKASRVVIAGNDIENVGEGMDIFANGAKVYDNKVQGAILFGIKLIHGASFNDVTQNTVVRSGLAGIVVAGTPCEPGPAGPNDCAKYSDIRGNLFYKNAIDGAGNFDAVCNGGDFDFPRYCGSHRSGYAFQVMANHGGAGVGRLPRKTFFVDNEILVRPGGSMAGVLQVSGVTDAPGDPRGDYDTYYEGNRVSFLDGAPAIEQVRSEPGQTVHYDPLAPETVLSLETNRDGARGLFLHRSLSGDNRLLQSAGLGVFLSTNIIDPRAINGLPDLVRTGDFNGDGRSDLVFVWKSLGVVRQCNALADGTFGPLAVPFAPNEIQGDVGAVLAADFNDDGYDDLIFVYPKTGDNRLFEGGVSGFVRRDAPIGTKMAGGDYSDALAGDFNGDGKSDVIFLWRDTGANRMSLGTASGPFGSLAPIPAVAMNDGARTVSVVPGGATASDGIQLVWSNGGHRLMSHDPVRGWGWTE